MNTLVWLINQHINLHKAIPTLLSSLDREGSSLLYANCTYPTINVLCHHDIPQLEYFKDLISYKWHTLLV